MKTWGKRREKKEPLASKHADLINQHLQLAKEKNPELVQPQIYPMAVT